MTGRSDARHRADGRRGVLCRADGRVGSRRQADGRRDVLCRADQQGSVLVIVLGLILFLSLLIAAVMAFAGVSLRATIAYRGRTEVIQSATGGIDLAVSIIRPDTAIGVFGGTPIEVDYEQIHVTCTGLSGSGAATPSGPADRRVECVAARSGSANPVIRQEIRFVDGYGSHPGTEVEILNRTVSG